MATLTGEAVEERRTRRTEPDTVLFRVSGLYGFCSEGAKIPLGRDGPIDSGPITVTIDPDAGPSCNLGVVNFSGRTLKVRYGVQAMFPALHDLVTSGNHDPGLLNPVRIIATDDCSLTPDVKGWRALGCLDFLPGSAWSGAKGG